MPKVRIWAQTKCATVDHCHSVAAERSKCDDGDVQWPLMALKDPTLLHTGLYDHVK